MFFKCFFKFADWVKDFPQESQLKILFEIVFLLHEHYNAYMLRFVSITWKAFFANFAVELLVTIFSPWQFLNTNDNIDVNNWISKFWMTRKLGFSISRCLKKFQYRFSDANKILQNTYIMQVPSSSDVLEFIFEVCKELQNFSS